MRKSAILGAVAALGMSGAAFAAEGVSHSFLEAGYGYSELAGGAADGDGFHVAGSIELPSDFIVDASYRDHKFNSGGVDADATELSAGLGYKWALGSSFDLIAGASYEQVELESLFDESGFGINLGFRGKLTDNFELATELQYVDLSGGLPSYFAISMGGRYYFNPSFAAGIDFRKSEVIIAGSTQIMATLRYDFGKLF